MGAIERARLVLDKHRAARRGGDQRPLTTLWRGAHLIRHQHSDARVSQRRGESCAYPRDGGDLDDAVCEAVLESLVGDDSRGDRDDRQCRGEVGSEQQAVAGVDRLSELDRDCWTCERHCKQERRSQAAASPRRERGSCHDGRPQ